MTLLKFLPAAILLMLIVLGASAYAAGPATAKNISPPTQIQARISSASPQVPVAIPLTNVATQAAKTASEISALSALDRDDPKEIEVAAKLPHISGLIDRDLNGTLKLIQEQPSLGQLQALGQIWHARQDQLAEDLEVMTRRATLLQEALGKVEKLQKTWLLTRDSAKTTQAPPEIVRQADEVLETLGAVRPSLEKRRNSALVIMDAISHQLPRCNSVISLLNETQQHMLVGLMAHDRPPIWSEDLRTQADIEITKRVNSFGNALRSDLVALVTHFWQTIMVQCGLFLALLILFYSIRRRLHVLSGTMELPPCCEVLESPLYVSLALAFYFGSTHLVPYTLYIRMMMKLLALPPMIMLVRHRMSRPLYVLGLLFAVDLIRQGLAGAPLLEQIMLILEAGGGIWALRSMLTAPVPSATAADLAARRQSFRKMFARIGIPVLAVGILAAVLGYLRLARVTVSSVLAGAILVLTFFTFVLIISGIVAFLLRSWPLASLGMVSRHGPVIERRTFTLLVWIATVVWLISTLSYIGVLNPVMAFGTSALDAKLQRGTFSISLGDFFAFVLTVWLAFMLAALLNFVLNEEVFPRSEITQGTSYAVSSLLRYLIIVIGFIAGLGALGLTMDRITILLGAFGVGIGFGLQAVVNNFISGLILLFERPVHVGDTLEFGTTRGEVRRIGIRSSNVHTFEGADVIVPNSQLVTDIVTNWTYSDQRRRIDLPFGVNYGADAKKVINLAQEMAQQNGRILESPPCVCFFTGFGDSTVNFELRAWTDQFNDWYQIRSELGVALYDAIREAGVTFAFPQREVRLLKEDKPGQADPAL